MAIAINNHNPKHLLVRIAKRLRRKRGADVRQKRA